MNDESYEQFLARFIDTHYAASALWMWNFPLVPSAEASELIKAIYANRTFNKDELTKAFEALA